MARERGQAEVRMDTLILRPVLPQAAAKFVYWMTRTRAGHATRLDPSRFSGFLRGEPGGGQGGSGPGPGLGLSGEPSCTHPSPPPGPALAASLERTAGP